MMNIADDVAVGERGPRQLRVSRSSLIVITAVLAVSNVLLLLCLAGGSGRAAPNTEAIDANKASGSPLKWHLLIYTGTPNELQNASIADMSKILSRELPPGMVVSMLLHTRSLGNFRVRYEGGSYTGVHISEPDTMSGATLEDWIVSVALQNPAEKVGLIIGGHSYGWYLNLGPSNSNKTFPIVDVAAALSRAKQRAGSSIGKFEFLALDSCNMGTVESMFQLHGVVDAVLAYQGYGPWSGFITTSLTSMVASTPSTEDGIYRTLERMAKMTVQDNEYDGADPVDVSVVDTRQIPPLMDFLLAAQLRSDQICDKKFAIDQDYYTLMDLKQAVLPHVDADRFCTRFSKALLLHQTNRAFREKTTYIGTGLSFIASMRESNDDAVVAYNRLKMAHWFAMKTSDRMAGPVTPDETSRLMVLPV